MPSTNVAPTPPEATDLMTFQSPDLLDIRASPIDPGNIIQTPERVSQSPISLRNERIL